MASPSPTSSPRRTHFDLSHSAPISFLDAFGRETTFLDEPSFRYKAEVIKYFDGNVDLPAESPEEFLTVLQAVLTATDQGEEREMVLFDRVKDGVRRSFLELYEANQAVLERTKHPVHKIVRPMVAEQEEFGYPAYVQRRSDPMEREIFCYLDEEYEEETVIEKYLDQLDPAKPCDQPEEFYQLYAAILRNCPKGSSAAASSSMHPSGEAVLRERFDALYEANQQGLGERWAEADYAREIEQLRSGPFVPSFRAPPIMRLHSSDTYSMHHTIRIIPILTPPMENFSNLEARLGEFDFEGHGLGEYREQIIDFYNGRPQSTRVFSTSYPFDELDFYEVLKVVFTQLKAIDVSLDESIETEVKQRFIQIFDFALQLEDGEPGQLTESQISEMQDLVGTKRRRVRFAPHSMGMEPQRPFMLMGPRENFTDLQERLGEFDFAAHGLSDISERIIAFYEAVPTMHPYQGTGGYSSGSASIAQSWFPVGERDLFTVLCRVFVKLQPQQSSGLRLETVESVVRRRFLEIFRYAVEVDERQGGLNTEQVLQINRLLGSTEVVLRPTRSSSNSRRRIHKRPPSGGGNGGNRFVQIALLLLVGYLGVRFVVQPAWQWYRGNKTTPVVE
ncbi:MAG: hypothetical protein KDK96_09830 [Chlamydiia bacterium]|nr:hypothetical protein [Chlamydiia bacterium]